MNIRIEETLWDNSKVVYSLAWRIISNTAAGNFESSPANYRRGWIKFLMIMMMMMMMMLMMMMMMMVMIMMMIMIKLSSKRRKREG